MASPMACTKPPAGDQAHPATKQSPVEKFVNAVHQFSGNDGYQLISAFVDETQNLRMENKKLESELAEMGMAARQNFALIQKVEVENNEKTAQLGKSQAESAEALRLLELAQAEQARVKQELETNRAEIDKTMKSKKALDDRINKLMQENESNGQKLEKSSRDLETAQKQLADIRKQHAEDSQILATFQSKAFPLRRLDQTDKGALFRLHNMFDEAYNLVYRFFGQTTLEAHVLSSSSWQSLENDKRISSIGLPSGNSEAASHVRVALILRLLAMSASDHIFQPVYLAAEGRELGEILESLYLSDASQAHWIRSVLLNITPEAQPATGRERADMVRADIIRSVDFLIRPSEGTENFRSALAQWCRKAVEVWLELQKLEVMIHGTMEVHIDDFDPSDWMPLAKSPVAQGQIKQAGSSNGTKSKNHAQEALAHGDIATHVWPAFFVTGEDGVYGLVKRGRVLTTAFVAEVAQEACAASAPEKSRRGERGKQRKDKRLMMHGNNSTDGLDTFLPKSHSAQKRAG